LLSLSLLDLGKLPALGWWGKYATLASPSLLHRGEADETLPFPLQKSCLSSLQRENVCRFVSRGKMSSDINQSSTFSLFAFYQLRIPLVNFKNKTVERLFKNKYFGIADRHLR
jgi:hypothetical protein